jgi:hypothetical protein
LAFDPGFCLAGLAFVLLPGRQSAEDGAFAVCDMSREPPIPLLEKFGQRLNPFLVFIGIFTGFSLMVLAGRWAGKQNLLIGFERSYPLISPEGYFYPSLNNLTELVSHVGSRRKILVLVGGDSVLLGVGQKKDQLWTKELQRVLGPDFVVINLAYRGARPTEMGAVVAEALSKKYPRLIYVANAEPMSMPLPLAGGPYGYLNWEAQASGELPKGTPNLDVGAFAANRGEELSTEGSIRGYFDFWSHASDLWNYLGYKFVFTAFNSLKVPPERFFEARNSSQDQETDVLPIPQRFTLQEQSMRILRMLINLWVEKDAQGDFRINPGVLAEFNGLARVAFPNSFKPKTFILLVYNAPYFVGQLSRDEQAAYDFAFSQGKSWLEMAGYRSALIGRNWTDDNFADRAHLTASGGQKMATAIAPEIKSMAVQLGYLPAASKEPGP